MRMSINTDMTIFTEGKLKGSKGHAGGTGKKGKKFVEDKVC